LHTLSSFLTLASFSSAARNDNGKGGKFVPNEDILAKTPAALKKLFFSLFLFFLSATVLHSSPYDTSQFVRPVSWLVDLVSP
jgi:hypothetical protein